ncbi:unnamed protein product [Soboliphyme baturini]|uniref:peptidylamidoglycolate lyase n=1 Tax=Soboliphyme baturini TaxID=241478 RepID=A0A3P8ARZ5_9BILA|nr:unnamed protein product [Soboliphyme baturini]
MVCVLLSVVADEHLFAGLDGDQYVNDVFPKLAVNSYKQNRQHQIIGPDNGVDVDQSGNLHVFHRGSRTWNTKSFSLDNRFNHIIEGPIKEATHLVLNGKTGTLLQSLGANQFYMPHGLTCDKQGNVWLTDVALHQPTLVLGEAFVPGSDQKHFCKPTDVAVLESGDAIFVADGYCNSRIVKFDSSGKYIQEYGGDGGKLSFRKIVSSFSMLLHAVFNEAMALPALAQLNVPHSLALFESISMLCVADRENQRVLCFLIGSYPFSGKVLVEKDGLGRVYAICSSGNTVKVKHEKFGGQLFGVSSFDDEDESTLFEINMNTLEVGFHTPNVVHAHDIAADKEGNLYIASMNPNQVTKLLNMAA